MRAGAWAAVAGAVLVGCGGTTQPNQSSGGPGSGGGSGQYTLAVHIAGNGEVQSSSLALSCVADCERALAAMTAVRLIAVPASGSSFAGWQGACSGTGPCAISMSADAQVTATFN